MRSPRDAAIFTRGALAGDAKDMGRIGGLEQAFADVENAADAALKSASALTRLAKRLQKAAKEGNVAAMKRAQEQFDAALDAAGKDAAAAVSSWPLEETEEEAYLKDGYADELRAAAEERGLTMHERDGRLLASPSIVSILPGDRAARASVGYKEEWRVRSVSL